MEKPQDLTARYYLTYEAMLAGTCFDNGFLHLTHALEHPLSGMNPDVIHGHGLAILLPAVIREIYPNCMEVLNEILSPIRKVHSNDEACKVVQDFIERMGVKETLMNLGFTIEEVDKLVDLTFTTPSLNQLLALASININKELIKRIYISSL